MSNTPGKVRGVEVSKNRKKARSRANWNRRLARCGIAVLLAGLLAAGAFVYFSEREGGEALALSDPIPEIWSNVVDGGMIRRRPS